MATLFGKVPAAHYKPETNISIAAKAVANKNHRDLMAQSTSTCFRCDKAIRRDKTLTGTDIPFIDSAVKILHDVVFRCRLLERDNQHWRMSCTSGTKLDQSLRCSGCVYGIQGIQAEKKPIKVRGVGKDVQVSQVLYKCSCKENGYDHPGEYCTGYFLCANYEKKGNT